jgi:pyrroline-5-carboxylate reductase
MNSTPTALPEARKVAIVGAGVMGTVLVTALRAAGWPADQITAATRTEERAKLLRDEQGIVVELDAAAAVKGADVVMLAVKPQDMAAALDQIGGSLKDGVFVVTVAAALPTSFYEARLPKGTPVVRAMPNTPSVISRGATGIAGGAHATATHLQLAAGMLKETGLVVTVDEAQMDAVGAVSGSGPAYFYAFVEALTEAGVAQGLDRTLATQLAAQTFVGAAQLLHSSGDTPQQLRQNVSSKGGTTLAGLAAMEAAGLQGVIAAGLNAAIARTRELTAELGD